MPARCAFLRWSAAALLTTRLGGAEAAAQAPVFRGSAVDGVEVLYPRMRSPLSFVIDDSTCLVNMGSFCMPQFAEAWPRREIYRKPWRTWPREIPDSFVREFADFCDEQDVRGKYSIVPYPACVGWVDREMPGWSRRQLLESLKLVRERIVPRFDIHPEMITHTRVIDLKSGRPLEEISAATMENSYPQEQKSVDEMAAYLAYALRILKNAGLPCEGVTTPGGFGNAVKSELSLAVFEAVRDVYSAELPHYFKYVVGSGPDTDAKLEHVREPQSDSPRLTVNVPAGTGDWFGGWDGDRQSEGHRYATDDASGGRMVELIEQGRPAVMLCHWPGIYGNGSRQGFEDFRRVVRALNGRFGDRTQWMTLGAIARHAAARELTRIESLDGRGATLQAPLACPAFTVRVRGRAEEGKVLTASGAGAAATRKQLKEVGRREALAAGSWLREDGALVLCFDLARGRTRLEWS